MQKGYNLELLNKIGLSIELSRENIVDLVKVNNLLNAKGSLSAERTMNRKSDFDISLEKSLANMRRVVPDDEEYQAMKFITETFFSAVTLRTDMIHHVLSVKQCERIYANLTNNYEPVSAYVEDVVWQIKRYLYDFIPKTDDTTMEHFATAGILEIGEYELPHKVLEDEYIDYRAIYIVKHPNCIMAQESRKQLLAPAT